MDHSSLEPLEPRQMLSNSADIWRINGDRDGTATDDQIVIRVSRDRPGRIEAVVNGVVVSSRSREALRQIFIKSRGADDRVNVRLGPADQHLLIRIYGGRGDDVITGGAERDQLFGGPGADVLNGGAGRDKLKGQAGADRLQGGNDHVRDILHGDASDTFFASVPDLVRQKPGSNPPAQIVKHDPGEASTLEEGINRFAVDLYSVLAQKSPGKNLFFSPYSIATALGMLAAFNDKAALTVAALLHRSAPELVESFNQFLDRWRENPNDFYQLNIANAAWASERFGIPKEFRERLQAYFNADVPSLDFSQQAAAAKAINDWISQQTNGRIPTLIDPSFVNKDTYFVLTNAIYFKGKWTHGFDPKLTRSLPFALGAGKTKNVAMMHQQGTFNYFGNSQLQLLELPYKGDDLSVVVLLPRKQDGFQQLAGSLSEASLSRWLDQAQREQVYVYLPRFEMDNKFSLLETLEQLGLDRNLSDLDFISGVVHRANIEVNEEGTVAAAATAIGAIHTTCVCPPRIPQTFNADHPFLYAIRDRKTGGLLFLGQETAPPAAPAGMGQGTMIISKARPEGLVLDPIVKWELADQLVIEHSSPLLLN
jgi:serpin B